MLIFDNESRPVILDNVNGPCVATHMWVLDLNMEGGMDFTMAPLLILEEIVCPSVSVRINGAEFIAPAYWNILVFDKETRQLDVVNLSEAAGKEFTALIYGPRKTVATGGIITITNYFLESKNVAPSLNKHQMLCHPIGYDEWVAISPSDTYNKYLKDAVVGDLIGG